jgi:ABC-type sugar transport system ATPase subunit
METPSGYLPPNKSLVLDRATKRCGSVLAVAHADLMVDHRESFAIVGPTACGKTTLFRLIPGLEKIDEGHIYIHSPCVNHGKPSWRGVRMVFQDNRRPLASHARF